MNEQTKVTLNLQSVINHYRNKFFNFEHQFVLYKAKVKTKIKGSEKGLDTSGPVGTKTTESKKRKSTENT